MDNPGYSSLEDESTLTHPRSRDKSRRSLNCSYELACHGKTDESPEQIQPICKDTEDDNWSRIDLQEDSSTIENPNSSSEFTDRNTLPEVPINHFPLTNKEKSILKANNSKIADKSLPIPINHNLFGEEPICRICHDDDCEEELVSPCFCDGTVGLLHISCLETWLGTSKKTRCEICNFEFSVVKKPRSWKWYLANKSLGKERRRMISDIICCSLFTPFSLAVTLSCLIGASYFATTNKSIQGTCLILLATANICIFILWCVFSCRRNHDQCATWRENYQVIKISYDPPQKPRPAFFNRSRNMSSLDSKSAEKSLLRNSLKKSKKREVPCDSKKAGLDAKTGQRTMMQNTLSGAPLCNTIDETVQSPKREPKWKDISRISRVENMTPLPGTPWPGKRKFASTSTPMTSNVNIDTSTPANPAVLMMNRKKIELCRGTPYMPTPVCPRIRDIIRAEQSGPYMASPKVQHIPSGHGQISNTCMEQQPLVRNIQSNLILEASMGFVPSDETKLNTSESRV